MKEIFKDIKGFEKLYQVSNFGRIKSKARRIKGNNNTRMTREVMLIPQFNKDKINLQVQLYNGKNKLGKKHRKTKTVANLVAEHFIKRKDNKHIYVIHLDGNHKNNRVDNLKWITHSELMFSIHRSKKLI